MNEQKTPPTKLNLEKNDFIEADIDGWGYDGEGVAHVEGAAVFIKNAIKGERVRAKIIYAKKNFYFAVIDKILEPAQERVIPPCPYFPKCGGCDLQHIDYSAQLKIKRETLFNTLKKQLKTEPRIDETVPSDDIFSYRNKLFLAVRGEPCELGFFAKNSHRIVGIKNCLLQNFDAEKLIQIFTAFMENFRLKAYDETTHSGDVRHLAARRLDGRLIITVVTLRPLQMQLKALNDILKSEYGNGYALFANLNDMTGNVVFSDKFTFIGGNNAKSVYAGFKISAHPAAFFQVNDSVAKKVYERVVKEAEEGEKSVIIDAYAGAGTLSLLLSKSAEKVYSIEINEEAHKAAKTLCADNNVDNVICVNDDCKTAVPHILKQEKNSSVTIVLDPPRAGCAGEVIAAVKDSGAKKVIYVSCNPATLARDLSLLEQDYNIVSITPYDMFPQTANLETLAVLSRKK